MFKTAARRSRSEDKLIKFFPGAQHQLFFEYPAVRQAVT
jgi:hypothetical protein